MQSPRLEIGQALAQAVSLQRGGQFAQSERLCRAVLQARPAEPTALHLLGVCLLQQGRYADAEQALAQTLRVQPRQAAALTNRGIALQALRRFDEALGCYEQALALEPRQPATLNMRGLVLMELKRHDEALASFDAAVQIAPGFAEGWCGRANALTELRRYEEALDSLDRAEALRADYGEALSNRSIVLNLLRRHEQALAAAQRAARLLPDRAIVHRNLGDAYAGLSRYDDALACFSRAIDLDPRDGLAYAARAGVQRLLGQHGLAAHDLERALERLGEQPNLLVAQSQALTSAERPEAALEVAERALAREPDSLEALAARAAALSAMRRMEEALSTYDRLVALRPDDTEIRCVRANVLNDLGRSEEALAEFDAIIREGEPSAAILHDRAIVLAAMGRLDEAVAGFAQASERDPTLMEAQWNESLFRLQLGQYEKGWRKYETRRQKQDFVDNAPKLRRPLWNGSDSPAGRTIVLHGEQGLGDVIQFARYAPLVAARGATVYVGAYKPLERLLRTLRGIAGVISIGDPMPPYDLHAPLMSMPAAFATTLETVPAEIPYLHAEPGLIESWKARLDASGRPRIGLAWSGNPSHANDHRRSMRLAQLAALFSFPAQFVCLSKLVRDADREDMRRFGILHPGDELTDFAETAALTTLMDLVISVDTSIAHLAGALGRPVWLLLSNPPDYRWMLDRRDSPWYPTARLFRQPTPGDWQAVVARMALELESFLLARSDATPPQ